MVSRPKNTPLSHIALFTIFVAVVPLILGVGVWILTAIWADQSRGSTTNLGKAVGEAYMLALLNLMCAVTAIAIYVSGVIYMVRKHRSDARYHVIIIIAPLVTIGYFMYTAYYAQQQNAQYERNSSACEHARQLVENRQATGRITIASDIEARLKATNIDIDRYHVLASELDKDAARMIRSVQYGPGGVCTGDIPDPENIQAIEAMEAKKKEYTLLQTKISNSIDTITTIATLEKMSLLEQAKNIDGAYDLGQSIRSQSYIALKSCFQGTTNCSIRWVHQGNGDEKTTDELLALLTILMPH